MPCNFNWKPIGGGSINTTYKITSEKYNFFIKTNKNSIFKNGFKEEVFGLKFLEKNSAIIPKIILEGSFNDHIYLILEWIDSGEKTSKFWKNFAQQLTNLHRQNENYFGLKQSNYMGALTQKNTLRENFSDFFIENRLKPQIKLAYDNNLLQKNHLYKFDALHKQLPNLLPKEKPCAVHGDLWSGNFICNKNQKAVLIDPAVYYGHREIDLAMSTLFGGFSYQFYSYYKEIYPLEKGFKTRKDYYNLYPLLIHLNLFGSSYLNSIETILYKF